MVYTMLQIVMYDGKLRLDLDISWVNGGYL